MWKRVCLLLGAMLLVAGHDARGPLPKIAPTLDDVYDDEGLVDIMQLSATFVLDLKYAAQDNFTGIAHYETSMALLYEDVAAQLLAAQEAFAKDGYRIKIYDAYRPYHVQVSLYEAVPPHLAQFVAKPSPTATHCKGIAVDMTLVDAAGDELPMPSTFDTFDESAYVSYQGGTQAQRDNRDYMIDVMQACGFEVYAKEWWHFAAPAYASAPTRDITFAQFVAAREKAEISH